MDLPAILTAEGYTVTVSDSSQISLTNSTLQPYGQLWVVSINNSGINFITAPQVAAIQDFRAQNKGVVLNSNDFNLVETNAISNPWGINFVAYISGTLNYSVVPMAPPHTLLKGIATLGSAYNVTSPVPMSGSSAKCVGNYNTYPNSCFVSVLDAPAQGRVVFDGDISHFTNQGVLTGVSIQTGDGPQYAKNIANWLQRTLYGAKLQSTQQVPTVFSSATGVARAVLSPDEKTAKVSVSFSGLSSPQTMAHIHGPAPRGQNAGILFTLPSGSFQDEVISLTPDQATALKQGQLYVNIHSQNFPDGEIRGQLE